MVTYLLSMRSFAGTSGPLAVLSVGAEGVLMELEHFTTLCTVGCKSLNGAGACTFPQSDFLPTNIPVLSLVKVMKSNPVTQSRLNAPLVDESCQGC